jgi:hypothetical protein
MWGQVQPLLAEGDFDHAREMTNDDKSTIAQMLSMGLARQGAVRRREDTEIAMEECMMEIIPQLENAPPTSLFSPISPPSSAPSWASSRPSPPWTTPNPAEMASVKVLNSISNSSKRQFPAGALDG